MDCLLSVLHTVKLQEARSERERIISEEKKSTASLSVAVKNRGCAAKQSSQESLSHPQLDTSSQHRSAVTSSVAVKNRGLAARLSSQESPSHPQLDTSSQHRSASSTPTPSKTALLPEKVITCNDRMIDTYTCM